MIFVTDIPSALVPHLVSVNCHLTHRIPSCVFFLLAFYHSRACLTMTDNWMCRGIRRTFQVKNCPTTTSGMPSRWSRRWLTRWSWSKSWPTSSRWSTRSPWRTVFPFLFLWCVFFWTLTFPNKEHTRLFCPSIRSSKLIRRLNIFRLWSDWRKARLWPAEDEHENIMSTAEHPQEHQWPPFLLVYSTKSCVRVPFSMEHRSKSCNRGHL